MDPFRQQVESDCEELLKRFREMQSVRFEVFSGIWRDMQFTSIFHGMMYHERRPFSRLILDIAYSYFLPPFNFQIRVGGLYLLYSLFHTQSAVPAERIRLALKDWEEVKKFEKDAVEAQHLDTVYILHQLMSRRAFHFTAMPTLFSRTVKKRDDSMLCEDFVEQACRPQDLVNTGMLEELSNVHELYEGMKRTVLPPGEPSCSLIHKDLAHQLRNTVMDFHKWQQGKVSLDENEEDPREGTSSRPEGASSQLEPSRRAALLASIKSKAFGEAFESSKARRHRQVKLDNPELAEPTGWKKPSLKARTTENIHLSGEVWSGAGSTTKISHLSTLDFVPRVRPSKKKRFKW